MSIPLLIIGGGLSGLSAAIRAARYIPGVLLVEKHHRFGGLNSYFYRNNTLFETGLHAITNFALPGNKQAPLNRLFRQLKLQRNDFTFCQQRQSEIVFHDFASLCFSNDPVLLETQVREKFPDQIDRFLSLIEFVKDFNPFTERPFQSTRSFLNEQLTSPLLVEMLLCPLMYYGSSISMDIDLSQFVIMFRSLFLEGMFRPQGSIKEMIDLLTRHLQDLGGSLNPSCEIKKIRVEGSSAIGVELDTGEFLKCNSIISTIGHQETRRLITGSPDAEPINVERLGFVETIFQLNNQIENRMPDNRTIIFFNTGEKFLFRRPNELVDYRSGVICFPGNFEGLPKRELTELRTTHLANYTTWKSVAESPDDYAVKKEECARYSAKTLEQFLGRFASNIVYSNTFTPITIERYTAKIDGAIYGSPNKIKSGNLGYDNLFLAGTDQGFLGIIGSMLSGVSMVNRHILTRF